MHSYPVTLTSDCCVWNPFWRNPSQTGNLLINTKLFSASKKNYRWSRRFQRMRPLKWCTTFHIIQSYVKRFSRNVDTLQTQQVCCHFPHLESFFRSWTTLSSRRCRAISLVEGSWQTLSWKQPPTLWVYESSLRRHFKSVSVSRNGKHHPSHHQSHLAKDLIDNFYVDNIVITGPTLEQPRECIHGARGILIEMAMNLREFASNSQMGYRD